MQDIAVQLLPILLAVTLHEVAHGWVALRLGDPTAKSQNRLSLNPIVHVDPIGTVLFPVLQVMFTGRVFFGWAKPVPVNPQFFRDPRRGMMWVALGGPAANLIQALVFGALVHVILAFVPDLTLAMATNSANVAHPVAEPLFLMCYYAVQINAVLMAFNLIPVPPLDGSRVAYALLPLPAAEKYAQLEKYGLFIVMGLIFLAPPGTLWKIIGPVVHAVNWLVGLR